MSLRDEILEYDDVESEVHPIRWWGGKKVEIRSLTGDQRAHVLNIARVADGRVDTRIFNPTMAASACYDPETGERLFTDEDVKALGRKNSAALEFIARIAGRLSGMGENAFDDAGKDSSATTSFDSSST